MEPHPIVVKTELTLGVLLTGKKSYIHPYHLTRNESTSKRVFIFCQASLFFIFARKIVATKGREEKKLLIRPIPIHEV